MIYTSQGKFADYFYPEKIDDSKAPPAENTDAIYIEEEEAYMEGDGPAPEEPVAPAPGPPADDAGQADAGKADASKDEPAKDEPANEPAPAADTSSSSGGGGWGGGWNLL